jgi:hypothetical protein
MVTLYTEGRVSVRMFNGDHNPPHVHVWTPNGDAQILVSDFSILRGSLSTREYEVAVRWMRSNIAFLKAEWERRNG